MRASIIFAVFASAVLSSAAALPAGPYHFQQIYPRQNTTLNTSGTGSGTTITPNDANGDASNNNAKAGNGASAGNDNSVAGTGDNSVGSGDNSVGSGNSGASNNTLASPTTSNSGNDNGGNNISLINF